MVEGNLFGYLGKALTFLIFFFTNDMMLFVEATEDQMLVILECLSCFCQASGQKVNFAKSSIYFSSRVDSSLACKLSLMSGIPIANNLGTYLGTSVVRVRQSKNHYKHVIDRVQASLAGKKTKHIALVGRVTLGQSVLFTIPYYTMQTTPIPIAVCDEIERITRNFIWGGSMEKRCPSLTNWDIVTMPKANGGLGIRKMRQCNVAFLSKLAWRLMNESNSLWA